jgi:hypothetical protein
MCAHVLGHILVIALAKNLLQIFEVHAPKQHAQRVVVESLEGCLALGRVATISGNYECSLFFR